MNLGFPTTSSISVTFGWLSQTCRPEKEKLENFLTGDGYSLGGFTPLLFGGGGAWSPGNGGATQFGFGSPGGGGGWGYGQPVNWF